MIRSIKWKDYNSLGNLELNFEKLDGDIYNTIILAGDNGTGKTTILDSLANFLNLGTIVPFEYINYNINNTDYTIKQSEKIIDNTYHLNPVAGFHVRINKKTGEIKEVRNGKRHNQNLILSDLEDIRHYGVIYSKARSGFSTERIVSSTTQQLDDEIYNIDERDDYTIIKQLIVDIDAQDNSNWMNLCKNNKRKSFSTFKRESKLYRFEHTFNEFFENIKFIGVDNNDKIEKRIVFKKNNKEVTIDDLSTGEKQIVFRGAYLLKSANGISNGIVLIDEPELSMHPKWQSKILSYYRKLFVKNGIQKVQMIIATHSPYIIKSSMEDKENVLVITLTDVNGIIKPLKVTSPNTLNYVSYNEINYIAFGIASRDYHNELYGCLQKKVKCSSVKACDEYIMNSRIFNSKIHGKKSKYRNTEYFTICTYVRNLIDHPDGTNEITDFELAKSIDILIELCKMN